MGRMKELDLRQRMAAQREDDEVTPDLHSYAVMLNGEVDGQWVRCASPGYPGTDRSCVVRITDGRVVFIYSCEGSLKDAYDNVNGLLGNVERPRVDHSAAIGNIFKDCVPATGTQAEAYLKARAITLPVPSALLYNPRLFHKPSGGFYPCMVAERRDVHGNLIALHRTFLSWHRPAKATIDPVRMDLGETTGTAIRLLPVAEHLLVGEGIETTLSAMQATGEPGWAAGSAMALRLLVLPSEVKRVTVLADGDIAGQSAADHAALKWKREGKEVRVAYAPAGQDFNDLLARGALT